MPATKADDRPATAMRAMRELKERFIGRCGERHAQMSDLVVRITHAQAQADQASESTSIHEMQRLAHEITGGGGTFGCPGLSEIAAELEAHLACCAAGNRAADDRILRKFLDRLDTAIGQAQTA